MVHGNGGVMGGTGMFMRLFWTLLIVLSISAIPNTGEAQSRGFGGSSSDGALGGLLDQLRVLQSTGAIDALEGRSPSILENSRAGGENAVSKLQMGRKSEGIQSESGSVERGLLNDEQKLLARLYCRGELDAELIPNISLIKAFSPLEKDYCQRASELLMQYGYGIFRQTATQ